MLGFRVLDSAVPVRADSVGSEVLLPLTGAELPVKLEDWWLLSWEPRQTASLTLFVMVDMLFDVDLYS